MKSQFVFLILTKAVKDKENVQYFNILGLEIFIIQNIISTTSDHGGGRWGTLKTAKPHKNLPKTEKPQ